MWAKSQVLLFLLHPSILLDSSLCFSIDILIAVWHISIMKTQWTRVPSNKVQCNKSDMTWLTSGISRAHSSPPSLQLICKAIFWVTLLNLFCCDMVLAFITYINTQRWQYTATNSNLMYRALAKGPMGGAPYIGPKLGMGWYSRYQCRIQMWKSTQVSYPRYLHNSNISSGY